MTTDTTNALITLADVDAIEAALVKLPDCKLIVVDPIGSFLGGGTDAHRDNEVRGVLAPIAKLAEKYGPAVLVVAHRRKSAGALPMTWPLGSRAFTGIARAVWHLTRDNDNKVRRLLLPGKNNLAREGDGLAFSIIGEPPRIVWERDPVAMSRRCLGGRKPEPRTKARPRRRSPGRGIGLAAVRAGRWPATGERPVRRMEERARGQQTNAEARKKSLDVEAYRDEVPGPWWWRLPAKDAKPTEDVELGHLGILAETAGNLPCFDARRFQGRQVAGTWHPWPRARAGDDMTGTPSISPTCWRIAMPTASGCCWPTTAG